MATKEITLTVSLTASDVKHHIGLLKGILSFLEPSHVIQDIKAPKPKPITPEPVVEEPKPAPLPKAAAPAPQPPKVEAPIVPEVEVSPVQAPPLDSKGVMFNPEFHVGVDKVNKDGSWRMRRKTPAQPKVETPAPVKTAAPEQSQAQVVPTPENSQHYASPLDFGADVAARVSTAKFSGVSDDIINGILNELGVPGFIKLEEMPQVWPSFIERLDFEVNALHGG